MDVHNKPMVEFAFGEFANTEKFGELLVEADKIINF